MQCVNERRCILKMDYKRQTTVLSIMFVFVGMMFLVPAMTEKAQASISAHAETPICCFSGVKYHMYVGKMVIPPFVSPLRKTELTWFTMGNANRIFGGGDERGFVAADVGPAHVPIQFNFFNPAKGSNTCSVDPPWLGKCDISGGTHAGVRFDVIYIFLGSPPLPNANGGDANGGNDGDDSGDAP
jgi:hypothetical protein